MVRQFVRETFEGSRVDVDDAVLVAGEMATNAVRHTPGPFVVLIHRSDTELAVGVRDTSPVEPSVMHADAEAEWGFGMQLVDRLADSWHMEAQADGKTTWARLRLR